MDTRSRSTSSSNSATSTPTVSPAPSSLPPGSADVRAVLEILHGTDPAVVDRDELAALVRSVAGVRSWLDAYDVRCARRTRELADTGKSEPTTSMFARSGNRSNRDAAKVAQRNRACEQLANFEEALADGKISAGHVDAAADAMRRLDDETRADFTDAASDLLAAATTSSVDEFSRQCNDFARFITATHSDNADADELERQRSKVSVKEWVDKVTGMCHTHLELDPIRNAAFWSSVNTQIARLRNTDGNARTPWNQLKADAVVAAVTGGTPRRGPTPTTGPTPAAATTPPPTGTTMTPSSDTSAPAGGIPSSADDTPTPTSNTTAAPTACPDASNERAAHGDPGRPAHGARPSPTTDSESEHRAHPDTSDEEANGQLSFDDADAATLPADDDSPPPATCAHDDDSPSSAACTAEDAAHALRVPEITLLADLATLIDGLHDHGICETEDGIPVPVSTVRRLCCDAEIIPVILDTNGVPLDMGRSVRTCTRAQRRALRAMHRTCAHPDCTVPFSQCKAHHIRWWWRDKGPTDIDNMLPLCERHHHLVHEGRWVLTMTPDRIATWTRPDGTVHHQGTTIDRQPSPITAPRHRPQPRASGDRAGPDSRTHPPRAG